MKKRGLLFLVGMAALLAIMAGAAKLMEERMYRPPETETQTTAVVEETTMPMETAVPETTEPTMPTLPQDAINGKQVLNILITGQDRRDVDEWGRSDSMILCSINAEKDTVTMISFLRDLYLEIPGNGSNRLNAAYSWGGIELLEQTLTENFGVTIDGTIEIDFFDFVALIDHLGGVDIELTDREAEYINNTNADWALTEGQNHLNGDQALIYSRIRYLDSDFVRTERQRKVLTQVMDMLQELSWNELLDAMDMLLENSTLSFTGNELMLYTLGFYPVLMDGEIISTRVPADGTWEYDTVRGMSVVKANIDENREILDELLAGSGGN